MESKKKVACDAPSSSGIYVITVNTVSLNNIWVCDTSCSSYIWFDMQGPRNSRKLTKGESHLRIGDSARVMTVSVGTYVFEPPLCFCLNLEYCYYVPALTKNNILVSCFEQKGFCVILCNFVTMVVTL